MAEKYGECRDVPDAQRLVNAWNCHDKLLAERDAANAACNEVLNSLEWSGDGYEWNPQHGDYREQPIEALRRGQRAHLARIERLAKALERLIEACPMWMSSGPDASRAMTEAREALDAGLGK